MVAPVSATITAKDQVTAVFDTEIKAVAYNYKSEDNFGTTINLCNSVNLVPSSTMRADVT